MKRLFLIILLVFGSVSYGALTKTETTQAQEWVEVPGGAATDGTDLIETGTIDVSDAYSATLHIDCCISSTTAHTGTKITVQIASEAGVDDAWTTLTEFIGPIGTCTKSDFKAQEAAAQTILDVTDPATGNLDHHGKFIFLEDTATVAKSEIAYLIANTDDDGDTITVRDGITNQKETTSDVFTINGENLSPVGTYAVAVPASASQARVIFNNNYDIDGSTVHVRVRVSKLTAL